MTIVRGSRSDESLTRVQPEADRLSMPSSSGSMWTKASASLSSPTVRGMHFCTLPCCKRLATTRSIRKRDLSVQVGQGQKGRQVTAVVAVDKFGCRVSYCNPTHHGGWSNRPRAARFRRPPSRSKERSSGSIPRKGFGFVACDDGGKDVFPTPSSIRRTRRAARIGRGTATCDEGPRRDKGREAISLTLLN